MNHWLGRSALERDPGWVGVDDLESEWREAFVLEVDPEGRFSARDTHPVDLASRGPRRDEDIRLGGFDGRPWFARPVEVLPAGGSATWREVEEPWQAPVAAAVALVRWHAMATHCENCGGVTRTDSGGARRRCPSCGLLTFPRQDPAVIVAVLDPADRLLLASQRAWPPERVSIIAGFVEAGESLEQACWREVEEEVGITLEEIAYVSSQPWPMPRSLMLGFVATTNDVAVRPDDDEIAWGRFWTREELRHALGSGDVKLPGTTSIARQLIDAWLENALQRPRPRSRTHNTMRAGNKQ